MADDKTTVYRVTYEVEEALSRLQTLRGELKAVDKLSKAQGTDRVQKAVKAEAAAYDKLNTALKTYRAGVKASERDAVRSAKAIEKAILRDEKAMDRAAKAARRAQQQFKRTFLSIGKTSSFGMGSMVKNAMAATAAYISLYKIIQKIGSAKDQYLRFDELTTATMTIAKAGDRFFEHGSAGAERYRDAIREAADEVKTAASEMADSALFWAKAGQTNANTIVELSKVGTVFARANRDASNNVLDQARANDILSDALQLFRKDTSTTEKARTEAVALGDKLTAAANAGNIVVEQLFEYSKKVGGLFKTGEVADEEIMAIATSMAAAGLKEESGVHVRRILTQLAKKDIQGMLKSEGIEVANEDGSIKSFGEIFGKLESVLEKQKPLDRIAYLKDLFGQRAVSTAAAMAGLNKQGTADTSLASIQTIVGKIQKAEGMAARNQAQYLSTAAGRVTALTSVWGNAFNKMLADSGIIEKMLSGLENIDAEELFAWLQDTAVPALESFGTTMRDTVIPGLQMAGQNLSEWLSPAFSVFGSLLGNTTSSAEGLADTITTLVKLWVKWRVAMLAIRGLRMVDWLATFVTQATAAATASRALGTATTSAVATSKTTLATLPAAFTGVGVAITAAIAAWGLYEALVGPIRDAERRLQEFKKQYGSDLSKLKPGDESFSTLQGQLRNAERSHRSFIAGLDPAAMNDPAVQAKIQAGYAEIERLKGVQAQQTKSKYGVGSRSKEIMGGYVGGQSVLGAEGWASGDGALDEKDVLNLWTDWRKAADAGDAGVLATAQGAYEQALNEKLSQYQGERAALEQERDEAYDRFLTAGGDDRAALEKTLGDYTDQIKSSTESIDEYTQNIDEVAKTMSASEDKKRSDEAIAATQRRHSGVRGGAFQGGGTNEINPFATPLLSGLNAKGDRVTNIALQKGLATDYFRQSPEARGALARQLKSDKNVIDVHYGDTSISVTAKTDAKPEDIARAIQKKLWEIGRHDREGVQRVRGSLAPPEI